MKRLVLIFALLGLCLTAFAQTAFQPYAQYDLQQKKNRLPEILRCESGMNLHFGYSQLSWYDPGMDPLYTIYGFHYGSDYVFPIWGPLGLDLKWLGLTAGFGRFNEQFASFMSWDFGLMPVFNVMINDKFQIRAFGGIRAYISFLMDGTDSFPLTTLSDGVDSIGKGAWLNSTFGAEFIIKKMGIRFSYENGLSGRVKEKFVGSYPGAGPESRYKVISLGLVFWML